MATAIAPPLNAQTTDPQRPTKEYVRLGSRVVAIENACSISGRVTSGGSGLSGATVALSGTQAASTTSGTTGDYSFPALRCGGTYTVTASKPTYSFSPPSITYTNLATDQTQANFAASTVTWSISGYITYNGSALANVTVTLSGGQSGSTSTNTSGYFAFGGLPAGGNYTLTPALATYTFSPPSLTYNSLSQNISTANFTASRATYTIGGRVTLSGAGLSAVTISVTGSSSVSTNSTGYYTSAALTAGGNYTVTPSKTGYTFSPASLSYTSLGQSVSNANFTATAVNQYPYAVQVSPSSGTARRQTIMFVFRDPDGYSDLQWTQVEINSPLGGASGCVLYYSPADSSHVSVGDSTSNPNWRVLTFGSGSATSTSLGMCKVYPATSSRILSGTDVTLQMDMEFSPSFSGYKGVWMSEKDYAHSSYVYWVQLGSWTVPAQISGSVTMGTSGLASVKVSTSSTNYTYTDSSGNYALDVTAGNNYTVTPTKTYYIFNPASTTLSSVSGVRTANFAVKATVSITNTTRTGHDTDFKVGDSFRVSITGPPNQTVTCSAVWNGTDMGTTAYGSTSSTGTFTQTGTMPADVVGTWTEIWRVGPVQSTPTLVFTVSP